ncbi:MAG: type VI secretion system-associated protein TagF [Thiothrix litoralis]
MSDTITTAPAPPDIVLGFYGKVPTHGDFVGKGLPRSFRDPWDTWVQEVINASRQQMGQAWIDHFLTCPLYRFALSAGIAGEQAWLGVIIPCVDQVGRYYPMTLCRSLDACPNLLDAMPRFTPWYEEAETLVMSCLKDDFSLEQFEQQVATMAQQLNAAVVTDEDEPTSLQRMIQKYPGAAWRMGLGSLNDMNSLFPGLLNLLIQDFCVAYSLWWTQGSEDGSPSFLLAKGLPPFAGAAAMLDGNWQQWGWVGQQTLVCPSTPRG